MVGFQPLNHKKQKMGKNASQQFQPLNHNKNKGEICFPTTTTHRSCSICFFQPKTLAVDSMLRPTAHSLDPDSTAELERPREAAPWGSWPAALGRKAESLVQLTSKNRRGHFQFFPENHQNPRKRKKTKKASCLPKRTMVEKNGGKKTASFVKKNDG